MMRIKDLMNRIKDLPEDTLVCVAEVDEAFAANIAEVEIVEAAKAQNSKADGKEAIDLSGGDQSAVVIRW